MPRQYSAYHVTLNGEKTLLFHRFTGVVVTNNLLIVIISATWAYKFLTTRLSVRETTSTVALTIAFESIAYKLYEQSVEILYVHTCTSDRALLSSCFSKVVL